MDRLLAGFRMNRKSVTGGVAALLVAAGCQTEAERLPTTWSIAPPGSTFESCPLPDSPESAEVSATMVLKDAEEYCNIVAVPVTTLRPSPHGSRPDPGQRIVMTSDGRYLTNSAQGQQILEWSPEGEFLRAVGAPGEGPGELSPRGAVMLFLGPADSLFVLDGGERWSVFGPDFEFERSFPGRAIGRDAGAMHLVEGYGILSTIEGLRDRDPAASFHWSSFEGVPGSSFGGGAEGSAPRGVSGSRISGLDGSGGFWVLPPNGAPTGMTLERWSFEGEPLSTLERHVPWLPREGYPVDGDSSGPDLPEYEIAHTDQDGLLWVLAVVRDLRWRPLPREEMMAVQMELFDARAEVIDPASGTVVASFRYDGPDEELPPFSRFLGGRRSYRVVEDDMGGRSIEIYDIHLVQQ